jgi:hypothetical protein
LSFEFGHRSLAANVIPSSFGIDLPTDPAAAHAMILVERAMARRPIRFGPPA